MQSFARIADQMYSASNSAAQPDKIPDLMTTGYIKLQDILKTEYAHNSRSRFCWGTTQTHDLPSFETETELAGSETIECQFELIVFKSHLLLTWHVLRSHIALPMELWRTGILPGNITFGMWGLFNESRHWTALDCMSHRLRLKCWRWTLSQRCRWLKVRDGILQDMRRTAACELMAIEDIIRLRSYWSVWYIWLFSSVLVYKLERRARMFSHWNRSDRCFLILYRWLNYVCMITNQCANESIFIWRCLLCRRTRRSLWIWGKQRTRLKNEIWERSSLIMSHWGNWMKRNQGQGLIVIDGVIAIEHRSWLNTRRWNHRTLRYICVWKHLFGVWSNLIQNKRTVRMMIWGHCRSIWSRMKRPF